MDSLENLTIEIMGRSIGPITLSVGVAAFPDHGLESEFILQSAESALPLVKTEAMTGSRCCDFFGPMEYLL